MTALRHVAKELHVLPLAVRYWVRHRLLACTTSSSDHRRFQKHVVATFTRRHGNGVDSLPLRVLIIDQDAGFSSALADVLASLKKPIEWTIACDGYTAGLQTLLFSPDVLMVDSIMSGVDSRILVRQLKKLSGVGRISVIAMTQQPAEHDMLAAAGVDAILTKPFTTQALLEQLSNLTEQRI